LRKSHIRVFLCWINGYWLIEQEPGEMREGGDEGAQLEVFVPSLYRRGTEAVAEKLVCGEKHWNTHCVAE